MGSQKWGKQVSPAGLQQAWGNCALVNGAITAMVLPYGGQSGSSPVATGGLFCDVYGVSISSSDTTVQAITLSDGVNTITWQVGAPSPIQDDVPIPYRFRQGQPLIVSAGAVTTAKTINVSVRAIFSLT